MTKWQKIQFEELILDSKDGEWGLGEEAVGYQLVEVIRGTDFADLYSPAKELPLRWIKDQLVERKRLISGDLILETAGGTATQSTGRSVLLNHRFFEAHLKYPVLCSSFSRHLRLDTSKCSPEFISYLLKLMYANGQMAIYNLQHTGVSRFQFTTFKQKTHLKLPPLPIQRRLAEVLGRYDALIENYQHQIGILEAMAQNLYREWFVRERCPHAQASDFELKSLSEIAQVNVLTISEKDENAVIKYVDISSVGTGRINDTTTYVLKDAPGRAKRLVQHGDIVFSTVRPENRSYALILFPASNLVFSTGFAVITPNQPFYSSFIYCSISTDAFITEIANKAKGAAYPQVGFDDLMETTLTVPSEEVLMKFHRMAEPIFQKAQNLQAQTTRLRQMRDKLLPRLMSGQLSVKAASVA